MLRLTTQRFGQTRPVSLEILADRDRRTPSTREATRVRYLRALERVMLRGGGSGDAWGEWKAEGFWHGNGPGRRALGRRTRADRWCMGI